MIGIRLDVCLLLLRKTMVAAILLCLVALAAPARAQRQDSSAAPKLPKQQFITANGVRLQYLDWGGTGGVLLFLTSLGGTAGDFHPLAVQFTDRFHVLGLTRRGQGDSEKPDSGYDTTTLTRDVVAFLDAMKITRVTLAGYSMAGNELTELAGSYPGRVDKLVYLDAAYDLAENAELGRRAQLNLPPIPGADRAMRLLIEESNKYHPDYSRINAPALGFFVTYAEAPAGSMWDEATKEKLRAFWYAHGKAYRREQIERFQTGIKAATVVELHNTTHAGFVFDSKQQAILVREMRRFLVD